MIIHKDTRVSKIIKAHPGALEAIIQISPRFEKLRNPVLRKIMASRTSITMASRIGGCSPADFYNALAPLGFIADDSIVNLPGNRENKSEFELTKTNVIISLDVREMINNDHDPLQIILKKVNDLREWEVLKIISGFIPDPLIQLLQKQGFQSNVKMINDHFVETYFRKIKSVSNLDLYSASDNWSEAYHRYRDALETIDVRYLEMPGPMIAILEKLKDLPKDKALFVYHKKVPALLFPELKTMRMDFRYKQVNEKEVHLLIFSLNDSKQH